MAMDISIKKRLPLATLMEDWAKLLEGLGKGKEVESETTLEGWSGGFSDSLHPRSSSSLASLHVFCRFLAIQFFATLPVSSRFGKGKKDEG